MMTTRSRARALGPRGEAGLAGIAVLMLASALAGCSTPKAELDPEDIRVRIAAVEDVRAELHATTLKSGSERP